MPVPSHEDMMLPLLRYSANGSKLRLRDAREALAKELRLSDQDLSEMYSSGNGPVFDHRVRWAKTYLSQAGLLESEGRGYFKITQQGVQLLRSNPRAINNKLLMRYPKFVDFSHRKKGNGAESVEVPAMENKTPEDVIEQGHSQLRKSLELELLAQVRKCSPAFFEKLVVELLVRMGYGGSRRDAGEAIGKTGDGGIDGIIKEDKLGLDVVYVQAKRWENTVGRPEIQQFAGALLERRARKGVFLTTSAFSPKAREYDAGIEGKVVLIDGQQLARLMIEHGVGVSTVATYEVKRIDLDYFVED